jgi:hypothetical protein
VLRAAETARRKTFLGVVSIAPAVEPAVIQLNRVAWGTKTKPLVLYSENDLVLKMLFRITEISKEPALGNIGVPDSHSEFFKCRDASLRNGKPIGHLDYEKNLYELLRGFHEWWNPRQKSEPWRKY